MERNSFVFYKEWKDAINGLPGEVRLEVYEAIVEYGTSGTLPTGLKPMAMLAFNFIKTTLDKDVERYSEICRKRSEAGKKGGAPTGNSNAAKQAKQAKTSKNNQKQAKQAEYDSIHSDKHYVIEYHKERESREKDELSSTPRPPRSLEERKREFRDSLDGYIGTYDKDMVDDFFGYWTEPDADKAKMRFEMQPTWDIGRRMSAWAKRESNFQSRRKATPVADAHTSRSRLVETKSRLKEMEEHRKGAVTHEQYLEMVRNKQIAGQ